MRTTHRLEPTSFTAAAEPRTARPPARQPTTSATSPLPAPSVAAAMRLLHRSAAAPNGFLSADERAYLERRRGGE